MSFARVVSSVYLIFMAVLFILVGVLRFAPPLVAGIFMLVGLLIAVSAGLCISQSHKTQIYLKKFLIPFLSLFWLIFTITMISFSFRHFEGGSPWPEVMLSTLVCFTFGLLFVPFIFMYLKIRL